LKKATILILFLIVNVYLSFAQVDLSNLKSKIIYINKDTIILDSLSIVPYSIIIKDKNKNFINKDDFIINYAKSLLILKNNKSIYYNNIFYINYRVFPFKMNQTFYLKDTSLILKNYDKTENQKKYIVKTENQFFKNDKLNKNGTISRGFQFGNQRDLSTISNLNLQLSGKINDEVSIRAAISENNIPIQPEGNTQQLQEFDKVYVELFTNKSGIILGDIDVKNKYGYFIKLDKKVRGLNFYSKFDINKEKKIVLNSELTGSIAKGKYNKLKINGIEGNQGPYKLTGFNNEIYIIVMSGSEKVYIDGKLLKRGVSFDYVIDYNSAEITFTTLNPINKNTRITVEYEYTERNYSRVVFFQANKLTTKKADFWINIYSEKDNKNDPLNDLYSKDNKQFLSTIGDSVQNAFLPNIVNVEYDADMVLYQMKDTVASGNYFDSVFVYSTNPNYANYRLSFSYIGENMGNYKPVFNSVNGRVYEWIAPINGIKQGNYEPIVLLITPKSKFITNIGSFIKINNKANAFVELAVSNYDANIYSKINNNDDIGYAMKLRFNQNFLNADTSKRKLQFFINYQMADKKFNPIENYRKIEFERDWNLDNQTVDYQEQNISTGLSFFNKNIGFAQVDANVLTKSNNYIGKKANYISDIKIKEFQLFSDVSYLNTNNYNQQTRYLKHNFLFAKHFNYFTVGLSEKTENNNRQYLLTDSLTSNSFKFEEYSAFINQADSAKQKYFIKYKYRKDYLPVNNSLINSSESRTYQLGFDLKRNKQQNLKTVINYRNLNYIDSVSAQSKQETILSGRFEYNLGFFKRAIYLSGFYETSTGLEPKNEYQYIEVQAGQGQYTWIDYNNNNIKEIDEFELAKFIDQANYIRLFLPTTDFVRVYTSQLNQLINIQPARVWRKKKGFKGFLSLFSDNFSYNVLQKTNIDDYIPDFYDNKNILSLLYSIRNKFSFNSKNRLWQIDYLYEESNSKLLLVNGLDYKSYRNNTIMLKKKFFKKINFSNFTSIGNNSYNSEYFSWKNYLINFKSNKSNFQIKTAKNSSLNISYKYTEKNNTLGIEYANIQEFKLVSNHYFLRKANLQSNISLVNINFTGETQSSVSYQMLEALKVGKNIIWGLTYNRKLSKIFQLSINYSGRMSENNSIIHNGGMRLSANF